MEMMNPIGYIYKYICNTHTEIGEAIFFMVMESTGKGFVRAYEYIHSHKDTIFICCLNVMEDAQKKGMGGELMKYAEQIGKSRKKTRAMLWVQKNSWMHKWYKRLGYKYHSDYEDAVYQVWLEKEI